MTIEYLGVHHLGSPGYIVSVTLIEALQQVEDFRAKGGRCFRCGSFGC